MSRTKKSALLLLLDADARLGGQGVDRTTIVKRLFLAEQLRPQYEIWSGSYNFIRYQFGPYSREIFDDLEFLVFHGFVGIRDFRDEGSKVSAVYEITKGGKDVVASLLANEPQISRHVNLFSDLTYCLQELGIRTAKQICAIAYQEPEFKEHLEEETREGKQMLVRRLPSLTSSKNRSFVFQTVVRNLLSEKLKAANIPRSCVRLYLRYLIDAKKPPMSGNYNAA